MRSLPVLSLVMFAACAGDSGGDDDVDCTKVSGADEFVVGLDKPGVGHVLDFQLMSATPSPPARDNNSWVVQINDAAGTPMDGMSLVVTPFMPAHQHGTPITVGITPAGAPGQYTLNPVNLWMPGVWETTIRAQTGTTDDSAVYTFCIN